MSLRFRLYWLRETGCDAGTPLRADELDPAIRERVKALAREEDGDIVLHLPFLDRREWKRRAEILRERELVREGDVIRCRLAAAGESRDRAATLALTDPAWKSAPDEYDPCHFQVWQRVSVALQKTVRAGIPELYFTNAARYEDRDAAYPMIVYEACRPCFGRARTEFTYDVADPETLPAAWQMIGQTMRTALTRIEKQLYRMGQPMLAHRYSPVWYQDILAAVKKRPKRLIGLLAGEAMLIDAVIDLGTERNVGAVNRFAKTASAALRNVYGVDMRILGVRVLDEATRALAEAQTSPTVGFRRTATRSPRGAQMRGSEKRKIATTGIPTAVARCAIPESFPM